MNGAIPNDGVTCAIGAAAQASARRPAVRWLVLQAVAVLALLGASCSGGGDDDTTSGTTDPPSSTTTTTDPPGTDPTDVQPYVEELLARLDTVTDQIVRDPSVVHDPSSPLVEEFTSIYAPEAEGLAGGLGAFQQSADAGTRLEPVNTEPTRRTAVTGAVETIDADAVKAPVCYVTNHRVVDADGNILEFIAGLAQPGEVYAVRVDGEWRLERADIFTNTLCADGPWSQ